MQLQAIITLANTQVQLALQGMERSLRATGCTLPLWVIPYSNERCRLPQGAQWLEDADSQALYRWLDSQGGHPTLRKYACLLKSNYLFVDTDVTFLQDPAQALLPYHGFVINCCHWMNSHHTLTAETTPFFQKRSTTYQKTLFNTGQWACDQALYTLPQLQAAAQQMPHTCLRFPYHEQPAINYLVHASQVPITSLTLPPHNIESSWAGHYLHRSEPFWPDAARAPFLLHWAGRKFTGEYPVDELFLRHLLPPERQALIRPSAQPSLISRLRGFARAVRSAWAQHLLS